MSNVPAKPGGLNLYRDGDWLVVPVQGAVFPNRCVKTNQPVEAASYPFEADLLWQQVQVPESGGQQAANSVARALFGGVGALDLARKRRLKYSIGLSPSRQTAAKRLFAIGIGLTVVGPILSVVLATICEVATAPAPGAPANLPLTIGAAAFGFVVMIIGIALFAMSSMAVLRVMRSDGRHVWLEGAHDDFVDALPESPAKWQPPFG